jgi:hypothetical protein
VQRTLEGTADRVWRLPEPSGPWPPDALALLEFANVCAWKATDPVLLELARLKVASLVGNNAGQNRRSGTARRRGLSEEKIMSLGNYFGSDRFDERERECLRFVEQFVIDVSGVTDADRSALRRVLGDETERFVTSLYITDTGSPSVRTASVTSSSLATARSPGSPPAPTPCSRPRYSSWLDASSLESGSFLGRPRFGMGREDEGPRPASVRARRSRNSICALVLRNSSAAHRVRASWTEGSSRRRMFLRSATRGLRPATGTATRC